METDFRISFDEFYNSIFGLGKANSSEDHVENHKCGQNITDLLSGYSRRFLLEVKTFLDLQTVSYVRSALDVAEAANTTTVLTEQSRTRRDLGIVAITMAVVALAASVSSLLYYNLNYAELVDHIQNLYKRIEEDRRASNRVINDIKILRTGEGQLAVRTNTIFEILYSMRVNHACQLLKEITQVELSRISLEFKLMLTDLITENLSDRIISVNLLKKLLSQGLLKESLIEGDITLFYRLCRLALVDVNVNDQTLLLTITCPQLQKKTDFLTFTVLSPPLTVYSEGKYLTRSLDIDFTDLVIPLSVLQRKNFSLSALTHDDLKQIRQTDKCTLVHGRQYCQRLLPIPPATFRCLSSMMIGAGGGTVCPQLESVSTDGSLVNFELGRNFAAVFQPDDFDTRGSTGRLDTVLHHGRGTRKNKFVCLAIPAKFKSVSIIGNGTVTNFSQSVSFAYDTVLGFKPEDAFVTKKLFSNDFAANFLKSDKNFFSLNDTDWETLKELDTDIFTRTMNRPSVDAYITTICLVFIIIIATAILLLCCCRRSRICWRCVSSTTSWVINGRGIAGVSYMDREGSRARSLSPDDTWLDIESQRNIPQPPTGPSKASYRATGDKPQVNLTLGGPDKRSVALGPENDPQTASTSDDPKGKRKWVDKKHLLEAVV